MTATEDKIRNKAKSRLKKPDPAVENKKRAKKTIKLSANWKALALSLITALLLFLLISYTDPESVKHFILPNSYLPFIFLSFFFIFFLFLFIFKQKKLSFYLSLTVTAFIFLKLQKSLLNYWSLIFILLIPIIGYLFIKIKERLL